MVDSHLILIAHGSKDPRWKEPFEKLEADLKKEVGVKKVSLCYMDFTKPSFEDVIKNALKNNFNSFIVLPLFMSGGGHVEKDIPALVEKEKSNKNIKFKLLPAIGEDPLIYGAIKAVAKSFIEL